jgi:hypothetical protein
MIEECHLLGYDAMQSGLHGVTSQEILLFIVTALITSNPTSCDLFTQARYQLRISK